eukprot:TRINITY_DN11654_c3_g1_i1.p1 TRINITY_DN11654_c3_g1~~TRINITY_DN11654_c3_g1_i1.p1  ORF type:complete len:1137 (+),score=320.70 TRINITY_DN11654_c3_g1_i1:67-3477(+)
MAAPAARAPDAAQRGRSTLDEVLRRAVGGSTPASSRRSSGASGCSPATPPHSGAFLGPGSHRRLASGGDWRRRQPLSVARSVSVSKMVCDLKSDRDGPALGCSDDDDDAWESMARSYPVVAGVPVEKPLEQRRATLEPARAPPPPGSELRRSASLDNIRPSGASGAGARAVRALVAPPGGVIEDAAALRMQAAWRGVGGRRAADAARGCRVAARRAALASEEAVRRLELTEQWGRRGALHEERLHFALLRARSLAARAAADEAARRRASDAARTSRATLAAAVTAQRLWRGGQGRAAAVRARVERALAEQRRARWYLAQVAAAERIARVQTEEKQGRAALWADEGRIRGAAMAHARRGAHARSGRRGAATTIGAAAVRIQKVWRGFSARLHARRKRWRALALTCFSGAEAIQEAAARGAQSLLQHAAHGALLLLEQRARSAAAAAARFRVASAELCAGEQLGRSAVREHDCRLRIAFAQTMQRETMARAAAAHHRALLPEQLRHAARIRRAATAVQCAWRSARARDALRRLRRSSCAAAVRRRAAELRWLEGLEGQRRAQQLFEPQNRRRIALQQLYARSALSARLAALRFAHSMQLRAAAAEREDRERREGAAARRIQRAARHFRARCAAAAEWRLRRQQALRGVVEAEGFARAAAEERLGRRALGLQRTVAWARLTRALRRVLSSMEAAGRRHIARGARAGRLEIEEGLNRGVCVAYGERGQWRQLWEYCMRQLQRVHRLSIAAAEEAARFGIDSPALQGGESAHRSALSAAEGRAAGGLSRAHLAVGERCGRLALLQGERGAVTALRSEMLSAEAAQRRHAEAIAERDDRERIAGRFDQGIAMAREAERARLRAEDAERRWRQEEEQRQRELQEQEAAAARAEREARRLAAEAELAEKKRQEQQREEQRRIKEQLERARNATMLAERARQAAAEAERAQRDADALMVQIAIEEQAKAREAQAAADSAKQAADKARVAKERVEKYKQQVSEKCAARCRDAEQVAQEARQEALDADYKRQAVRQPEGQGAAQQYVQAAAICATGDTRGAVMALPAGAWVEAYGLQRNTELNGAKGQLVRRRGDDILVSFRSRAGRTSIKVINMDHVRPCLRPADPGAEVSRSPPIPHRLPPLKDA